MAGRLWLASLGHNYDMGSWIIVSDLAVRGKNVYLNTTRYNYGPIWFIVLGWLRQLHSLLDLQRLGPESFHIVVAAFLSICDIGIAALLLRAYGLGPAIFFLLNPVSLLLTGHNSQMDNMALLPGLLAWMLIEPTDAERPKRWIFSAILLGISLSAKHILLFFPIWLLASPAIFGSFGKRVVYCTLAYGTFVILLVPFVLAPGAFANALKSFAVHSANQTAFLPSVIELFFPAMALDTGLGLFPKPFLLKCIFTACMLLVGPIVARAKPCILFHVYLLAMLIFASTMGDQYLAIPMITCAVYYRRWPVWMYTLMAAMHIETIANTQRMISMPRPWWHSYHLSAIEHHHAIAWLLFVFVSITFGLKRSVLLIVTHVKRILLSPPSRNTS